MPRNEQIKTEHAPIQVLDAHVADLIAAGEVVERPASVVKELVENAIDARASAVTIEIQRGGMALIRVTDNGSGIPAGQCRTAFLRHATSKLHTAQDLDAIGTLGFRGEALAAISSVSRVELITRTAEETLGNSLTLEGGEIVEEEPAGCPLGTTMVVRDLFYNTPARLKFMKRDAAEGAAVFALVQKLALSHPEVSIKFLRDGKQDLLTPGDGNLQSALYAVLGRDMALGFVPVQGGAEDVTVTGFVSLPACCRGSRNQQFFFVNGRQVKSKLLMAALERAYENQKMVGKFPGCALQLQLKANAVDVNVHPAKTEVKFLYERKVFDGVYYTVLAALNGENRHPDLVFPEQKKTESVQMSAKTPPAASTVNPSAGGGFQRMSAQQFREGQTLRDPAAAALLRPLAREMPPVTPNTPAKASPGGTRVFPGFSTGNEEKSTAFPANVDKSVENVENFAPAPSAVDIPRPRPVEENRAESAPQLTLLQPPAQPQAPETVPAPAKEATAEEAPWRLAGEILQTYLIVEQGDTVHLIDKHAAHERMNFDRMKAAGYQPMPQTLLAPVVFTPPPEEGVALLDNLDLLAQFGFACEEFGGGAFVVREIPDYLEPGQVEAALCELAGELLKGAGADPQAARDAVLHTMACKAAIKGGQKNTREELLVVVREVMAGRVKYCPHGRPVAVTMTRQQLEHQFKRS
ncbi:MAG: DNA mismatch repair endonuclease MutL [Bacillota bacterium]|nr:DNA mismatch repair endonuclease MutL [Bacillota bacterium]